MCALLINWIIWPRIFPCVKNFQFVIQKRKLSRSTKAEFLVKKKTLLISKKLCVFNLLSRPQQEMWFCLLDETRLIWTEISSIIVYVSMSHEIFLQEDSQMSETMNYFFQSRFVVSMKHYWDCKKAMWKSGNFFKDFLVCPNNNWLQDLSCTFQTFFVASSIVLVSNQSNSGHFLSSSISVFLCIKSHKDSWGISFYFEVEFKLEIYLLTVTFYSFIKGNNCWLLHCQIIVNIKEKFAGCTRTTLFLNKQSGWFTVVNSTRN